jgi:hypothetical protein
VCVCVCVRERERERERERKRERERERERERALRTVSKSGSSRSTSTVRLLLLARFSTTNLSPAKRSPLLVPRNWPGLATEGSLSSLALARICSKYSAPFFRSTSFLDASSGARALGPGGDCTPSMFTKAPPRKRCSAGRDQILPHFRFNTVA